MPTPEILESVESAGAFERAASDVIAALEPIRTPDGKTRGLPIGFVPLSRISRIWTARIWLAEPGNVGSLISMRRNSISRFFVAANWRALDSAPFVVDNTPPVIAPLALNQGRLQGTVTDGVGPIVRLEIQIDGKGPWRPIAPVDGILDEAIEKVDVALGLNGSHVIALRAFDQAGNQVTKEIEGK